MKKIYVLRIVLFIAIILVPVINMNFKKDQISEIDNRQLIEVWEISIGDVSSNIQQYVEDRIGFRSKAVNTYNSAMDFLFEDMVHPSYQYGKEGYIFSKLKKEVENREFQEVYSEFILTFQEYCKENEIDFLYALEPSKATVYSEYLPNGYNYENKNREYLLKLLEEKNINYIYTGEVLKEAKEEIQVFDKKYDAGHWNESGAIVAIESIIRRLNEENSSVNIFDINNFEEVVHINTTLPVSLFSINEGTLHYNLIENNSVPVDDYIGKINISEQFRTFTHFKNEEYIEGPKILVFAGSYFNSKDKFLTESFSEYIKIHNYHNVINYEYYIDIFKPDIILFESTEYTHSNNYFPIDKMKEIIDN